MHSSKDVFTFEAMDYQHQGKDRSLGNTTVNIAPLISEGLDRKVTPWISTGKRDFREQLRSGPKSVAKGTVSQLHICNGDSQLM